MKHSTEVVAPAPVNAVRRAPRPKLSSSGCATTASTLGHRGSRCATDVPVVAAVIGSAEGEEQLLELRGGGRVGAVGVAQAALQAGGDHPVAGPVQRVGDRGEQGEHVGAVAALLDHVDEAAQLAVGAAQPVERVTAVEGGG